MMGERRIDQGALVYEFCLKRHVRKIDGLPIGL